MSRELRPLRHVPEVRPWCTERLLRRLVAERRVPFHKVAGRILLDLDDIDAYAESGRVEPPVSPRWSRPAPQVLQKEKGPSKR